jgi:TonB family protein
MKQWFAVIGMTLATGSRGETLPPGRDPSSVGSDKVATRPEPSRPRVDLFPSTALAPSSAAGGPSSTDAAAGAAVRLGAREAGAGATGTVAPAWRDAERRIGERFHPSVRLIGDGPRALAAAKQAVLVKPTTAPATVRLAMPDRSLEEEVRDQILACQEAADAPAGWHEAEVETTVDGDGALVDARVLRSSGRAQLDAAALEAVRAAFAVGPVRDPAGRSKALWRVGAARAVRLPRFSPTFSARPGRVAGLAPQLPFRFDETTGKVSPVVPLSQEVRTRVELLYVVPAH